MATWEDGPEYAPVERPADFVVPEVAPLEDVPPPRPPAPVPLVRPHFDHPEASVAPLATLVPAEKDVRDPQVPFEVASATMTTPTAWGAAHWSPPQSDPPVPLSGGVLPEHLALAAGGGPPHPGPTPPPAWQATAPGSGPAEVNPGWLPPSVPEPQRAPATGGVTQSMTPGVLICLVIGGFIYLLAPITLVLAYALSSRIPVAQPRIRRSFLAALSIVGVVAFFAALLGDLSFTQWWGVVGLWALMASWVVLVVTWLTVSRAVGPPPSRPWG